MKNGLIVSDPRVMMGKPVAREAIGAALEFAAAALKADVVYPISEGAQ